MINRTKIGIVGDDISAIHLFNRMYKSDDRYEVICFFSLNTPIDYDNIPKMVLYPPNLAGDLYRSGIPVYNTYPYKTALKNHNQSLEKCIFSPLCVTSGQYLYLAAQFIAMDCSVISNSLEMTQVQAPKALVSFFSDTQFDIPILLKMLKNFKENRYKPVIAMAAPLQHIPNRESKNNYFFLVNKRSEFDNYKHYFNRHIRDTCEKLILEKYQIYFIYDFEQFSSEVQRNDLFDLIVFVGFNSLPCYFKSHLLVYACDEFTFGDDISEHPSSVLVKQADVVLYAHLQSDESSQKFIDFANKDAKVVCFNVSFSAKNQSSYKGKTALLIDDSYPTRHCNAAKSISKFLAEFSKMKPLILPQQRIIRVADSPIYGEQSENEWPALILPETSPGVAKFNANKVAQFENYDVIVSSTSSPCGIQPKIGIPLLQFSFDVKLNSMPSNLFQLPPEAFIKQRKVDIP